VDSLFFKTAFKNLNLKSKLNIACLNKVALKKLDGYLNTNKLLLM